MITCKHCGKLHIKPLRYDPLLFTEPAEWALFCAMSGIIERLPPKEAFLSLGGSERGWAHCEGSLG